MKKFITILTAVIMVLAVLASCSPDSSETVVNKGDLVKLGLVVGADSNSNYVLSDHEYTRDNYKVTAYYSSGWQEDVTSSAKIDGGEYMKKSSSGGLTFSSANTSHNFTVKVSYGGKEASFDVKAYKAEDIIGVKLVNIKFFEGYKLGYNVSDVKISYMNSNGKLVIDDYLPENSIVKMYDENDSETFSGTYKTIREFKTDDSKITFSIKDTTESCSSSIEVISKTEAKKIEMSTGYEKPQAGASIDINNYVKTYMGNYKVRLSNATSKPDVTSIIYITDSEGKVADGYQIAVSVSRSGTETTSGNFQKGDVVTMEVSMKDVTGCQPGKKTYTIE